MAAGLRAASGLLLAMGMAGWCRSAHADVPIRATLDDRSTGLDAGCVSATDLRVRTNEAVGRPVFVEPGTAEVRVLLQVDPAGRATIELEDTERHPLGFRTLAADSCPELTDALVLALSLMLDFSQEDVPRLREGQKPPEPEPPEETEAKPEPNPAPAPKIERPPEPVPNEPPKAPSQAGHWAYRAGAAAKAALGLAPVPSFAVGGALGVLPSPGWLFELNGSLGFERSTAVAAGSVRFAPWDVGSAVCPVLLELGNGGLRPCAAVAVGAVRLSGRGFDRDATGSSLLLRAGLEVRLEQRLGPFVFLVGIEGSAPIVGYRAVESGRELFRIMPIVAIPSAGVAMQLP